MDTNKIRTGIISEKRFVSLFADEKQKMQYDKNNHFTGKLKQSLLNFAKLSCDIEDIGNRQFKINKVYPETLPKCISKLHTGLYQYIIPLILSKLIYDRDQYERVNFTYYKWARLIDMINNNYYPIKKEKTLYSQELSVDSQTLEDYFTRVDDSIQYYIDNSLKYLQKAGVIKYYNVPMVCIRHVNVKDNLPTDKHNIDVNVTYEKRIATPEETDFALTCMDKLKTKLDLNDSQCFFGKHAQKFANELKKLLKQKDIEYFYDTYTAYCIQSKIKQCKNILSTYNISNQNEFISDFNRAFKSNIVSLAEKRYMKIPDSFDNNYIEYFKQLSNITIDKKSKHVKYLSSKTNHDEINEILSDDLDLHVNGNKIKIENKE